MRHQTKAFSNLWKLALFSLIVHAISLWAKPEHADSSNQQTSINSKRNSNSQWDPHAMIAGFLSKTNGPHQTEGLPKESWRNLPADRFQQEHQFLTARLRNNGGNLDQAELDFIKNRADRYVYVINTLKQTAEKIKKETSPNAENYLEKVANADKLIEALTIQLGDWNNLQAEIERVSNNQQKEISK